MQFESKGLKIFFTRGHEYFPRQNLSEFISKCAHQDHWSGTSKCHTHVISTGRQAGGAKAISFEGDILWSAAYMRVTYYWCCRRDQVAHNGSPCKRIVPTCHLNSPVQFVQSQCNFNVQIAQQCNGSHCKYIVPTCHFTCPCNLLSATTVQPLNISVQLECN